jgi:hypothetical protein
MGQQVTDFQHIKVLILTSENRCDDLFFRKKNLYQRLLADGAPWKLEKLKCILHYFRRVTEDGMQQTLFS